MSGCTPMYRAARIEFGRCVNLSSTRNRYSACGGQRVKRLPNGISKTMRATSPASLGKPAKMSRSERVTIIAADAECKVKSARVLTTAEFHHVAPSLIYVCRIYIFCNPQFRPRRKTPCARGGWTDTRFAHVCGAGPDPPGVSPALGSSHL